MKHLSAGYMIFGMLAITASIILAVKHHKMLQEIHNATVNNTKK